MEGGKVIPLQLLTKWSDVVLVYILFLEMLNVDPKHISK